jgi:hypothetical protein
MKKLKFNTFNNEDCFYNPDTGITNYSISKTGSTDYQQVVWWVYDQDDYDKNSIAQVRIGAPLTNTLWYLFRRCDIIFTPPRSQ